MVSRCVLILAFVLLSAGCAARAKPPSLTKDRDLMVFVSHGDETQIRSVLAQRGIKYVVHGEGTAGGLDTAAETAAVAGASATATATDALDICPRFFDAGLREAWHAYNGELYLIDKVGRPLQAYTELPPVATEARSSACQGDVGRWGDESGAGDYDGGHMVGSQLGGYGKRLNMVPQVANFNRGNWVQLENQAAKCSALSAGRLRYWVAVTYANSKTVVPRTMSLYLEDSQDGEAIELVFENKEGGGRDGTAERKRGVAFLAQLGCQ